MEKGTDMGKCSSLLKVGDSFKLDESFVTPRRCPDSYHTASGEMGRDRSGLLPA